MVEPDPFAALYACWLSEQIHPRQWAQHLSDTPGLREYVEARNAVLFEEPRVKPVQEALDL